MEKVDTILFDLDNTLYNEKYCGVLDAIDKKITQFIIVNLELSHEQANNMRYQYWQKHGTTLRGLMLEYDTNPQHYLDFVHDLDFEILIKPDQALHEMLNNLNHKMIIFTNSSLSHAQRVLKGLEVEHFFDHIYSIESFGFITKPSPLPYEHILEEHGGEGDTYLMIDDSLANLQAAQKFGIRTALIHSEKESDVDFHLSEIYELPKLFI